MHVHLVGIGGAGLSAIARVLLGRDYVVSGSDRQLNSLTDELAALGAKIFEGHKEEHCAGADILLISSAVPEDNPELLAARKLGIPVFKRADFLGPLISDSFNIAVAGSHGKTTTTGMITQIMVGANLDPSFIVGGVLPTLGKNGHAGSGHYFVIEADEYDHMFLGLRPHIGVLTNVEYDHPDLYPTVEGYQDAFEAFCDRIREDGRLLVNAGDTGAMKVVKDLSKAKIELETFGLQMESGSAQWLALDLRLNQSGGTDFLVSKNNEHIGLARLRIPGEYNVLNALAAIAVAHDLGIDFNIIRQSLASFGGVGRRFQVVGEVADVTIVDDYGHHPTEIRATLKAATQRYAGRRLWAVWQPHTFSRTRRLMDEFVTCFEEADRVIMLDIFGSREAEDPGIDPPKIARQIRHDHVVYIPENGDAADYILDRIIPGDVVITLSAGDGNVVGELVLSGLKERLGKSINNNNREKPGWI